MAQSIYLIYSQRESDFQGEPQYWSNTNDGWGDIRYATIFLKDELSYLPLTGELIKFTAE